MQEGGGTFVGCDELRQRFVEPAGMQFHVRGHAGKLALPVEVAGVHLIARPVFRQTFERIEAMDLTAAELLGDEGDGAAFVDAELGDDAFQCHERQGVAHQLARGVEGDGFRHGVGNEVEGRGARALLETCVGMGLGVTERQPGSHGRFLDDGLEAVVRDEHDGAL